MKKTLLLLFFALSMATLHAQNGNQESEMYEIMSHRMGYGFDIENFMRQHDGDFVFATFVSEQPEPGQWMGNDLGNMFYKMSPTSLTITDSLFVEDPEAPYYLFAQTLLERATLGPTSSMSSSATALSCASATSPTMTSTSITTRISWCLCAQVMQAATSTATC